MKTELKETNFFKELLKCYNTHHFNGWMIRLSVEDIMDYLLLHPEKKWFYANNSAKNKYYNEFDVIERVYNAGLIEKIAIPCPNGNGRNEMYRYRLDFKYNPDAYLQWE